MLLTEQQQHEERLRSLARTFSRANTTLVGRPVTVNVVNNRVVRAPGYSVGDDIYLNTAYAGKLDTTDDIIKVTGLDFHELAHAEYTPRQGSWLVERVKQEDLFRVFNMLEDQRIETLLVARYPSLKPYFVMTVMEYIAKPGSPLDMAHTLTYGRKYLPSQVREYIRDKFREPSLLDNIEEVIDEYRGLVFPDDDVLGLQLIRTFGRLMRATGQDHVQDPFGHSTRTRPDGQGDRQDGRQQQAQRDAQQQVDDSDDSDDDDYMPQDSGGFGHDDDEEGDDDGTDAGDDSGDDAGAGSRGSDDDDEGDDEASESAGGGDTDDDDEADDDADAEGNDGEAGDDSTAGDDDDQGDDSGDEDGDGGTEGTGSADPDDDGDGQTGSGDGESNDSDSDFGDDDLDGDDDSTDSGRGGGDDTPRELTDDELRDLAGQIADNAAARPEVQRDASVKKEAIKKVSGDIPTLRTKTFSLHPVPPDYALTANTFKRELMKLWADADPGWHTHRASGRVNVQRAMRGGEIDTLFDQWNEGNNEATSIEMVILFDYSYSMKAEMLKGSMALWAIKRAVEAIGGDVTVIGYSDNAFTFYDKTHKAERTRFRAFAHGLGTDPTDAIAQARLIMHYSKKVHRIVLFLTDGDWEANTQYNGISHEDAIQQFHAHGVMTALAYLGDFDEDDIKKMTADELMENFHGVQTWASIHDPKGLVTLAKQIVKQAMLQRA